MQMHWIVEQVSIVQQMTHLSEELTAQEREQLPPCGTDVLLHQRRRVSLRDDSQVHLIKALLGYCGKLFGLILSYCIIKSSNTPAVLLH